MERRENISKSERRLKVTRFFIIGVILLMLAFVLSISFGAAKVEVLETWKAIFAYDKDYLEHQVIREIRLPRTIADLIVGVSFALSGAIMQGVTRNPLADSGLLGINSGAGLSLALIMALYPNASYPIIIIFSFIGATIAVSLTYFMSRGRLKKVTPEKLVLAGTSVSLLFLALSQFIAIIFNVGQKITYWNMGGVAGVGFPELKLVLPYFLVSLVIGLILSPSITILNLGEDIANGLGQNTKLIKLISVIVVLFLASIGVSLVGPVGFVGLIIPHTVRKFVGSDYRYIIPCSVVYGGFFMIMADLIGRLINAPYETSLGIIFALIGVPFFLYIARKEKF